MSEQAAQLSPLAASEEKAQFRSQVGHISRQSGMFFAGTIFTAGIGYLFKVYLARVLGAENLGLYALGVTLIGFIGIFNTLGLPQSAVRFVAMYAASGRYKELHGLLWRGAGILLLANLLLAGVVVIFGRWVALHFYHAPSLLPYLPLFALLMMGTVVSTFYGKVLAGYRDLKIRTVIVNFIGSPLSMVIAILLMAAGLGLRGYLIAQIASAAAVCVLLVLAVRSFTPAEARFFGSPGINPGREVWSFSVAMLGIGFLEFFLTQVDKIALGYYQGPRQVGIYSVAAAVVVYVPLALSSVNQIFAPTIADLHTRGEHVLLARLFQSLTKWVVGLTLPLAVVVMVFARPLMRIFGHDFEVGWPILVIGTAGQLVNCGVGSVGYLLLMSGNEKRLLKVQITMTAVMVIGCAALIPIWGIYGAAAAAALANAGINAWNLLEVRKALGISPYNRSYVHLIVPALVTLAAVFALRRYSFAFQRDGIAIASTLALAYCVFPATFYLLSGLDADDRLIASALRAKVREAFSRWGAPA